MYVNREQRHTVEGKISINVGKRGDKQLEFQLFPSKHSLEGRGDEDGLETEVMSVIRNKWII